MAPLVTNSKREESGSETNSILLELLVCQPGPQEEVDGDTKRCTLRKV